MASEPPYTETSSLARTVPSRNSPLSRQCRQLSGSMYTEWNSGNGASPSFSALGVSGVPTCGHSRQTASGGSTSCPSAVNSGA